MPIRPAQYAYQTGTVCLSDRHSMPISANKVSFFSHVCSPKERKKKRLRAPKGVARGAFDFASEREPPSSAGSIVSLSEPKKKPQGKPPDTLYYIRASPRRTGSRARRRLVRRAQASDHRRGRSEHRRRRRRNAKTLKARLPRSGFAGLILSCDTHRGSIERFGGVSALHQIAEFIVS